MFQRIALVGTGSLGTILGAFVTKAGYDITLVDSYKEHVDALNEKGATVVGTLDMNVKVKAALPEDMEGIYDLVLFMVKQTYNKEAIANLKKHVDENTVICTLQNGFPEVELIKHFDENQIMGAPVGWGATFKGPGVSELTTDAEKGLSFTLGSYNGKVDERLENVKKVLESMCHVQVSENLIGLRFSKLLMNATFSGLSTALGCLFGNVLDDDEAMDYIAEIGKECVEVAEANDIKLTTYEGHDFTKVFCFNNERERKEAVKEIRDIWAIHYGLTASMLQDIRRGRDCEIDAINGVVCDYGDKANVDTPYNDMVVKIVKGIMNKTYPLSMENKKYFRDL